MSDWSLLDDSDFQSLKERVEQLERGSHSGALVELRYRVDKLEERSQWGRSSDESGRIQIVIEDLYHRVGDIEAEGEGRRRSRSGLRPDDKVQLKPPARRRLRSANE